MKAAILAAFLVGIAVAISDREPSPFRADKEYKYDLKSQSLSGIPHLSAQFTGFKIYAQTRLQLDSRTRAVVQFDNVQFYQLNDVLEHLPTHEIVPENKWQPVGREQEQLYQECFQAPILFKYDQGIVTELQVDQDEPEWCTNLKKGVLSLFQMDLSQQHQIEDVDPILARIVHENQLSYDMKEMYRTMEASIDGNCESVYLVQDTNEHSQSYHTADMEVTKIRNYDNCLMRPASEEGVFSSYVVDIENPHNQTGLRSYCHTNATMKGGRREYAIKDLKQVSQHLYTPLSEQDGEVVVFSVQELNFIEERNTVGGIQPLSNPRRVTEGLKMKLRQKQTEQRYTEANNKRVQAILALLEEYMSQTTPVVQMESITTLSKLMFVLRDCSAEDIIQVVRNLKESPKQMMSEETPEPQKLKVLLDVLPTIGRPYILHVMKFLIQEKIMKAQQAATAFNYITLTIKPTTEVLENLLPKSELFNLEPVKSNAQLRQAIILCSGTVQHGLTKAQKREPSSQYDATKKSFVTQLEEYYQTKSEEQEQVTVLKAIGNSGLPDFFPFVQKIATSEGSRQSSRDIPLRVRMNAVFALRRMPKELYQQIHSILVPIYQNNRNEYALRCVAYLGTIKSQPSYGTVQMIIHSLMTEKSQKVGAFVYAHLQDVAQSSRLSLNETRHFVRLLMKQAKPFFPRKFYSNSYSIDLLAKDLGIGQYLDVYIMDSEKSIYPSDLAAVFGQTLYGREMNMLEAGMDFSGLQDMVSRLVGPRSILSELLDENNQLSKDLVEIIKELLQPQQSGEGEKIDQFIRNIIEKLGLNERQAEEFTLGGYLKVLGNEVRLWLMKSPDMKQWIVDNEQEISKNVMDFLKNLKKGVQINYMQTLSTETSIVIPTQLGIPLHLNGSYIHILRTTGSAQLTGNLFSSQLKDQVELELDIKPSAAIMMKQNIGLYLPLLRSGVEVKTILKAQAFTPMRIGYQPTPLSFSVKYMIPSQQNEFIKVQAIPTTYITQMHINPSSTPYDCQQKEIKNQKFIEPVTMEFKYDWKTMGIAYDHRMTIPTPMVSFAPIRPFNGKHECSCKTERLSKSGDQYVEFRIQYSTDSKEFSTSRKQSNYRSSSRSAEGYGSSEDIYSGEFKPVEIDQLLQDPTKRVLTVQFQSHNTQQPRTMKSQVTLLTDNQNKCQLNAQFTDDQNDYKGMCNIVVDLQKILYPKKDEPEQQQVAKLDFNYGQQNHGSIYVRTGDGNARLDVPAEPLYTYKLRQYFNIKDIKVNGQNINMKTQSLLPMFSQYSDEQGQVYTRATVQMPEARNYAYKYTVEVNYENMDENVQEYAQYWYYYAKNISQEYVADVERKTQQSSPGKLNIYVRFMPSLERLHLLLDTPDPKYETVFYYPARLPMYLKRALTLNSDLLLVKDSRTGHLQDSSYNGKATCTIEKESSGETNVKTFDQMTYELPELTDECEVVLAQECKHNPLFIVLMTKQTYSQKVTIALPDHQIQLRVSQGYDSNIQVQIDGQDIQLNDGQKSTRLSIKQKSVLVEVIKTGDTTTVEIKELGLNVAVDQKKIRIQTSSLHSGKVCGLCGDYNGDVLKEMTGPREQVYRDPKAFALSYVVPSDNCDVPQLKERHNVEKESCSVQRRNVEPRSPPADETCVSIDPVNVCPRNCKPVNERTERIPFHCMRKQAPYHSNVKQLDVSIPESCEPRN